jgi:hypothetical protein
MLAYDYLPDSTKFYQFMVTITAYLWPQAPGEHFVARTRRLRKWHPDFAFDVMAKWIMMLDDEEAVEWSEYEELLNSCLFHEHLALDQDRCRERIKDKGLVFSVIIKECAKEGISMAKEKEGR